MATEAGQFSVLLAEDDAISQVFLCEAIRTCGGTAVACADGPAALARARAAGWDLLILDHHLPGMHGDAVLRALRADAGSVSRNAPAIATTAAPDESRALLLAAGFAEVVAKPLTLRTLGAALERQGFPANPLDDDCALGACGSYAAVVRLRRLFAEQELPRIQREFDHHGLDHQALRPTLHRLRASCGFCGATALGRASEALHHALATGEPRERVDAALGTFSRALRATRVALRARLDDAG